MYLFHVPKADLNPKEKVREVILHIGTPKTGTTALQLAFYRSREFLNENSISYPNLTESGFGWTVERGLGSGNANLDALISWESNKAEDRFAHIIREAEKSCDAHEKILLSSEVLNRYSVSKEFWETIGKLSTNLNLKFTFVIYLRDPFSWFISCYQQAVKGSCFTGSLDNFVGPFLNSNSDLSFITQKNLPVFFENVEKYKCGLKIYRYEDSLPSIENHFFSNVLGLQFEETGVEPNIVNTTFNMMELEFHRGVNSVSCRLGTLFSFERSDTNLARNVKRFNFPKSKFVLTQDSRKTLANQFKIYESHLKLLTNFGDRVNYSINDAVLADELSDDEKLIREQIFELGRFVAISHTDGYINWDWKRKSQV